MVSRSIAFFITPHGYGHATRSAAVMAALHERLPEINFEIFTTCPPHIFADSLQANFGYHKMVTDLGMVQASPLIEDPEATCHRLDNWLPLDKDLVNQAVCQLKALNCTIVVCDISPLGIVAGQRAGLPVLLVENFTWDWIYQSYQLKVPGLKIHIDYLRDIFSKADHRIQTTPLCQPIAGSYNVPPISRKPRLSRKEIRFQLNIPDDAIMVLVSMGGVPDTFEFLNKMPDDLKAYMVIPGGNHMSSPHKHLILLPTHSDFFHPDLMQAADVLVGKAGYSTVAEAYHIGIPFGYIGRPTFPESAQLEKFIETHLPSKPIDPQAYRNGLWLDTLRTLSNTIHTPPKVENGADAVAKFIHERFFR